MKFIVMLLAAVVLVLSGATTWQITQIRSERAGLTARFAASDARQTAVLLTILCVAREQTLTSKQRTKAEIAERLVFYDKALNILHAKPCDKETND